MTTKPVIATPFSVPSVTRIEEYRPKVLTRDWGTETFFAETPQYLGKVLRMKAGTKGGLQKHVEKVETFHLLSGNAIVLSDNGVHSLESRWMEPGMSFHIPAGAPHQVIAVTDCVLVEASTPHYDDRVRLEAEYGLLDTGGLPTTR